MHLVKIFAKKSFYQKPDGNPELLYFLQLKVMNGIVLTKGLVLHLFVSIYSI